MATLVKVYNKSIDSDVILNLDTVEQIIPLKTQVGGGCEIMIYNHGMKSSFRIKESFDMFFPFLTSFETVSPEDIQKIIKNATPKSQQK